MATPARPVQDAYVDPVWGQYVHDKITHLSWITFTKTTDASGLFTITAAEFGLSKIGGVVTDMQWSATGNPSRVASRLQLTAGGAVPTNGDVVQCEVTSRTGAISPSISVSGWAIAWGTPIP